MSNSFGFEVAAAMDADEPLDLVLAHEMPGLKGDERCACEFKSFFDGGSTPPELIKSGIYSKIAIALKGVEWRQPGLVALARALSMAPGEHKPITFAVHKVVESDGKLSERLPRGQPAGKQTRIYVAMVCAIAVVLLGGISRKRLCLEVDVSEVGPP